MESKPKIQRKVLKRAMTEAKKIDWRIDVLDQFHAWNNKFGSVVAQPDGTTKPALTKEMLMLSRPAKVVRVTGGIVKSGKRGQYVKGDGFRVRNPRGLK